MQDMIIARLRTAVPAFWGFLVAQLLAAVPGLPQEVIDILNSEVVLLALVAGATWAWHWLWSRVGPHIPDWLETIVMGHVGQASYEPRVTVTGIVPDAEDDDPVDGDEAP